MNAELYAQRRQALARVFRSRKLSHAYLFIGGEDPENEETIRFLVQILLCLSTEQPCGECRSCRLLASGNHPDFRVIEPEGGSIKLDDVRALCYDTNLHPYLSSRKVYFFKRFHTLTEEAANAFLKTLEEPPPGVYFLAQAEQELGLLPTIRSRMQRVNLGWHEPAPLETEEREEFLLTGKDLVSLFQQAEALSKKDREQVEEYLRDLQSYYRNQLLTGVRQKQPLNSGLAQVLVALQTARERVAANLNLRLLLKIYI
ncbi:MAG: hypothetical protein GX050_00755 [Firmicutes bacterium]|nr:hypothetical protein [Bacillota bacterium]